MAAITTSVLTGKKPAATESATMKDRPENPYLAARRAWDESYGHFITRERNWRIMALICGIGTLLSIAGLVWLSSKS